MSACANILFTKLFAIPILCMFQNNLTVVMSLKRPHQRAIYAALIIIAFFIPAYNGVSAFQFLFTIGSLTSDSEITIVDLLVIALPLLLIPATAMLILLKTIRQQPLNSFLLGMPFFSIAYFFLILSFDMSRQMTNANAFSLLTQMSIGFYVATAASVLLLFSYSRREALNLGAGH